MPLVHIELIEGRSEEQLKNLVKDVTDAVTKNTGAPAEHVHGRWRARSRPARDRPCQGAPCCR